MNLWTVEEAIAKAIDLGVSLDLRSIEVDLEARSICSASGLATALADAEIAARRVFIADGEFSLAVARL